MLTNFREEEELGFCVLLDPGVRLDDRCGTSGVTRGVFLVVDMVWLFRTGVRLDLPDRAGLRGDLKAPGRLKSKPEFRSCRALYECQLPVWSVEIRVPCTSLAHEKTFFSI